MTTEDVFLNDDKLRSICGFFLSLVLIIITSSFAYTLARHFSHLMSAGPSVWYRLFFFNAVFELLALLGSYKVMTLIFERKPLGVVGLAFHSRTVNELCGGLSIGGIMFGMVGAGESLLGLAQFTRNPLPVRVEFAEGGLLFLFLIMAAANEELVFRGYPFQRLIELVGPVGAVAVSSAIFGLMHLGNPHHTWISTANTMLVGVAFSIAYLRTRSLWMPLGMHFMWNYVQGFVFGFPVSGVGCSSSLLVAQVRGAAWLTGSGYGPEGGLLCTGAVAAAVVYLLTSPRISISERMRALVFGPSMDRAASAEDQISLGLERNGDGPA